MITNVEDILYFDNIKIYLSGIIEIIQKELKNKTSLSKIFKSVSKNFDSDYTEEEKEDEYNVKEDIEYDNYFREDNLREVLHNFLLFSYLQEGNNQR